MKFDWQKFCDKNQIHYVTFGPNTAKGNISIKCPLCGSADTSEHMGLSLNVYKPYWSCWRNRKHRGRSPTWLIASLLKISTSAAETLMELSENPDDYEKVLEKMMESAWATPVHSRGRLPLHIPEEMRKFEKRQSVGIQGRFSSYLKKTRGFKDSWHRTAKLYNLHWSVMGEYTNRIVIPVYYKGKLVTWTSRVITDSSNRYKTLESHNELRNIKDCLLLPGKGMATFKKKLLIVTEGPFDAMKLEVFSRTPTLAVCVFGLTLSDSQLAMLSGLRDKETKIAVMLDSKEMSASATMADQIKEIIGGEVVQAKLPDGVKDPGELKSWQVDKITQQLLGA